MANKKAFELSINFIVIIIISLVIFGLGIKFIADISSQAVNIKDITLKDLDEKISNLVCEGSARVCLSTERKIIQKKDFDVFGLKVLNILDKQSFEIRVFPPDDYLGFKKDKTPIPTQSPRLTINPTEREVVIEKNEEKRIGIAVQVPANAVSGTYILNIEIKTQDGKPYSAVQLLLVDVP